MNKAVAFFVCMESLLLCANAGTEAKGTRAFAALPQAEESRVASARAKTLVIGRVSGDPRRDHTGLELICDYVVSRLKDLGIRQGSVLLAKDVQQMIQYLKEGKVDWVRESVFAALIYSEKTGAEIMLRRRRRNTPTYSSVFFTRRDGGIGSLDDLRGKKIAFEDPGSTSSYFIPLAVLRHAGLKLVKLSSPREKAPADRVGYAFA